MHDFVIKEESPLAADILEQIAANVRDNYAVSPVESVHVFDSEALGGPLVTLWSAREAVTGELLGIGAVKELDARAVELKSMRTAEHARGRGVARSLLRTIISACRDRDVQEIYLETGIEAFFAPARALYAQAGFLEVGPFGQYEPDQNTVFLRLQLSPSA